MAGRAALTLGAGRGLRETIGNRSLVVEQKGVSLGPWAQVTSHETLGIHP